MQVILHCGAHSTEEDRLLKTLLRNKDGFKQNGTAVPGPGQYRYLLKDCLAAMKDGAPTADSRDVLWDAILEEERADRVILSNAHFFGSQRQALEGNRFYPEAEERLLAFEKLFPLDRFELFIGLRNPATMVPSLLEKASPQRFKEVLAELDPYRLRWSDLLVRLRAAAPDVPITVWCYEDMPLIWAQIVREMGGLEMNARISGGMDLLASIMSNEGMKRLRSYLHEHQDMTEIHKRRVFAAFLDKFALEDELEEEIDIPGWTDAMVETMTEFYEEDIDRIEHIPGVTLIST